MLHRIVAIVVLLAVGALPAAAQTGRLAALAEALQMGETIDVMRTEGLQYGADLASELFADAGTGRWTEAVDRIYDPARMQASFFQALEHELAAQDEGLAQMLAFFGSDRGQRIVTLELSARRALLDADVEDAARVMVDQMVAEGDPRMATLRRFAQINDLIESNISGAMNSNYAFYRGLADGGAFDDVMTEEQILADVWSQEPDIRHDTEDWLFPYLAMAYKPLSDEDLAAYIVFSESVAGQKLNSALFAAFDVMFTAISRDLGRTAALFLSGQDI
jgi:hypothetical protein